VAGTGRHWPSESPARPWPRAPSRGRSLAPANDNRRPQGRRALRRLARRLSAIALAGLLVAVLAALL
jgi:hypothetical protein